ncbi:MAG TPA: hypothetical protein VF116_21250 [Ktedonobacterales bacterium]
MADCAFCDWQAGLDAAPGGAIYQDDLVLARHAYDGGDEQQYLGALVLQTKRHATLADLTDDEARTVGWLAARLGRALTICTGAEKVYAYSFGEAFDHLHLFVVARYPGAPGEFVRLRAQEWPGAPRGGARDVAALVEWLRATIAGEADEADDAAAGAAPAGPI